MSGYILWVPRTNTLFEPSVAANEEELLTLIAALPHGLWVDAIITSGAKAATLKLSDGKEL